MANERYRLTKDLTRYDPAFVIGAEGQIFHVPGDLDCFTRFRLDSGAEMRVFWSGLERIDGPTRKARPRTPKRRRAG